MRDSNEEDARACTFFTSTKYNLGIRNCFDTIFNKINKKEKLWRKTVYEDGSEESEEENLNDHHMRKEEDSGFFSRGFLCCKKSSKIADIEKKEEKSIIMQNNESNIYNNEKLNFRDEDDEPGYDINVIIKPKNLDKKETEEKEIKNSGCILI
jgi:hypothetical protein